MISIGDNSTSTFICGNPTIPTPAFLTCPRTSATFQISLLLTQVFLFSALCVNHTHASFFFNTQVYFWTFFFTLYFLLSLSITCSSSTLPQTISQWGLWSLPSLLTAAEGITITFHSFACFHFWNISTTYSHWSYVTGLENLTNFTPSDRILLRQAERQAGGGGAEERPRQEKKTRWGNKNYNPEFRLQENKQYHQPPEYWLDIKFAGRKDTNMSKAGVSISNLLQPKENLFSVIQR